MRESVIYQEIVEEGLQQGLQQGKREEAISLIMRQLSRRIGAIDSELKKQIEKLSITQLEDLSEALLDFSQGVDLSAWLQANQTDDHLA